jgi:hypothetical protein
MRRRLLRVRWVYVSPLRYASSALWPAGPYFPGIPLQLSPIAEAGGPLLPNFRV